MGMNAKENYMAVIRGEIPEYLPFYTMFGQPWYGTQQTKSVNAPVFDMSHFGPKGGKDPWGVPHVANEETGFASLPEPNNFILDDITKWREVIKKPTPNDIDWELQAKRDFEKAGINREETMVYSGGGIGLFQQLMGFMGFNEGLCAMHEEPEEVKELFQYITDVYLPIIKNTMEYYKPDVFNLADDSATKLNPFVSVPMYQELLKPFYAQQTQIAKEYGALVAFHNCGRCEDYIPDMIEFGVDLWDPAQPENDLVSIIEKYKGTLTVVGGWDWVPPLTWPECDEEYVRQTVRDSIDKYAKNGGYIFTGGATGVYGDPLIPQINAWVKDEVWVYGHEIYK